MKTFRLLAVALLALLGSAASLAQQPVEVREPVAIPQWELDQILAPIALYPDSLLSQLLMAATYGREVGEAAAWSRANPGLRGQDAVRAVDNEPWDPSVKSLVAFPQILAMLDERMDWTERLGQAFLEQPEQVTDTIQDLRRRADEAGNLRSSDEIVVRRYEEDYIIEPASPEVVYVPYYDPRTVYGRWWWPDYEPVWWSPWVGYSWTPGYSGLGWGYGITLGSGFFYSGFDWPRRYIRFHSYRPFYWHGWSHRHGHRHWHDRNHHRGRDGHRGGRHDRWDGRRDGRRDGHWDGRRGDRDGRWDGRRGDRDGRWDGRRDGRDGRDGRRDGRASLRDNPTVRPQFTPDTAAPQVQPGVVASQPRVREARPTQRLSPGASPITRPVYTGRPPQAAIERAQRPERAQPRLERPQRMERPPRPERAQPQRVERPQPQRVERSAPAPRSHPAERSRPERSSPPERSRPERSSSGSPRSSGNRGGRDRD